MARALRIEIPGGRYHLTARGNERKDVFWDDTDRFHLLELLGELTERFGVRVHAYVLMNNHYHLLLPASWRCPGQPRVSQEIFSLSASRSPSVMAATAPAMSAYFV